MDVIKLNYYNRLLLGIFLLFSFFPAHAHLKWFVESGQPAQAFSGNILAYASAWLLIGLAVAIMGIFLDRRYPNISTTWEPNKIVPYATATIGIFVGASLLISALQGVLFSMNIDDIGAMHLTLLLLEGFIGLSLIAGLAVRQASLLLFGLWVFALFLTDAINVLENLWIPGAALFLFLRGRTVLRYTHEDIMPLRSIQFSHTQAISILRVFLGANLILLGFSEKIMCLHLGLAFLQEHPWNFMSALGIGWFTDELFVFSAGAVEIILGLFLIAGWITRLTAAVLAGLFLTPPFFMGAEEMIGHIPHITIVAVMLIFGRGTSVRELLYTLNKQWKIHELRANNKTPSSGEGLPHESKFNRDTLAQRKLHTSGKYRVHRSGEAQGDRIYSRANVMSEHRNTAIEGKSSISRLSKSRHLLLKELGL